ncbi:hypothetical protein RJZ56_004639 [Blastomyces dermatitidis]
MAPFRNFFPKRPAVNIVPASDDLPTPLNAAGGNGPDGPQRSSLTLRRSVDEKPNEYKMSVVNDNGVYLPDISARSPVSQSDTGASRTSLDSRFSRLTTPRSTVSGHTFEPPPKSPYEIREQQQEHEHENDAEQEQFVDIGLNEDTKPKKKGFFARLGDNVMTATTTTTTTTGSTTSTTAGTGGVESAENSRPGSSHLSLGFHLPGRKREQGGGGAAASGFQVAELGSMKMPVTADAK